jgi:hypothetical protein
LKDSVGSILIFMKSIITAISLLIEMLSPIKKYLLINITFMSNLDFKLQVDWFQMEKKLTTKQKLDPNEFTIFYQNATDLISSSYRLTRSKLLAAFLKSELVGSVGFWPKQKSLYSMYLVLPFGRVVLRLVMRVCHILLLC